MKIRYFFSVLLLTVFLGCGLSPFAFGQDLDLTSAEKKYYNENPDKLIPDARVAFKKSDYLQVQRLCRFHSFVMNNELVGERTKLWDDSKVCFTLSEEMLSLKDEGKVAEAKAIAEKLLNVNSNDVNAKAVLQMEISVSVVVQPEPIQSEPEPKPTPEPAFEPQPVFPVKEEQVISPVIIDHSDPVLPGKTKFVPRNRFGVSAGVLLYAKSHANGVSDIGYFAPELLLTLYDIGGSRIGLGLGALCVDDVSNICLDLSVSVRLWGNFYARAGIGGFRMDSDSMRGATLGTYANLGLTYVIINHLCINVGARLFPEVNVYDTHRSYLKYEYITLDKRTLMGRGLFPSLSVGWVF